MNRSDLFQETTIISDDESYHMGNDYSRILNNSLEYHSRSFNHFSSMASEDFNISLVSDLSEQVSFDISVYDQSDIFNVSHQITRDKRRATGYRIIDTIDLSNSLTSTPSNTNSIDNASENSAVTKKKTKQSITKITKKRNDTDLQWPDACGVCMEEFSSNIGVASTYCGHILCMPCMKTISESIRKCPICRKTLRNKGYHQLFF